MTHESTAPEQAIVPAPRLIDIQTVDADFLRVIPPRAWLYGRHYLRGMLTATTSPGGIGKSSLQLVEAVSMSLGRDLLVSGHPSLPTGPLNVWMYNGEDSVDEVKRRVDAVLRHYGYTASDLNGRLHVTSGRGGRIILAKEVRGEASIVQETRASIVATIVSRSIDVLIFDPFVSTHAVSENNNGSIELVSFALRSIAEETQTAIELAHHHRKLSPGNESSGDEMRGASALRDALRSARTMGVMSKKDARSAGIPPDEAPSFIWIAISKANLTPRSESKRWLKIVGVDLCNGIPPHESDNVGVATAWELPTADSTIPTATVQKALEAISKAHVEDRRFSKASTGWVGTIVARALGLDLAHPAHSAHVAMILVTLEKRGLIRKNRYRCARQGRPVPVYEATGKTS